MSKNRLRRASAERMAAPNLRERMAAAKVHNRIVANMADDFLRGGKPRKPKAFKKAHPLAEPRKPAGYKGSDPRDSRLALPNGLSSPRDMERYLSDR